MATLYFNNATLDGDWNTLGNWWQDSSCTIQALALPGISDDAILFAPDSDSFFSLTSSGSVPEINSLTIYGSDYGNPYNNNNSQIEVYMEFYVVEDVIAEVPILAGNITANHIYMYRCGYLGGINVEISANVTLYGCGLEGCIIYGNVEVYDDPIAGQCDPGNFGTIIGNITFYDNQGLRRSTDYLTVTGQVNFYDNSFNHGTIDGVSAFYENSYNAGSVGQDSIFNGLTGIASFYDSLIGDYIYFTVNSGRQTLYFNNSTLDSDWNTLGNWWIDSGCTVAANFTPQFFNDAVVFGHGDEIDGYFYLINSGSDPTIHNLEMYNTNPFSNVTVNIESYVNFTVTGILIAEINWIFATINGNIINYGTNLGGTFNGNIDWYQSESPNPVNGGFDGSTVNGTVTIHEGLIEYLPNTPVFNNLIIKNTVTFGGEYNIGNVMVLYSCIFEDYSVNNATIDGYATFNDYASNTILGIVTQNTIFNGYSYNDGGLIGTEGNDPPNTHTFNNTSYNAGIIIGDSFFNDSSFAYTTELGASYSTTPIFQNRTPYPLKRGVNSCGLLGSL